MATVKVRAVRPNTRRLDATQLNRTLASLGRTQMYNNEQNQTLTLRDGRKLGFGAYGVRRDEVVFYFHGSGSSRLERPLPEDLLARLKIRFISVDRPGNGLSDFHVDHCLLDWAKDIAIGREKEHERSY